MQEYNDTTNIATKRQLCARAFANKNYSECVGLCVEILALDHFDIDTWNLAGITMIEIKEYARAIEYLAEGLHLARERLKSLQVQVLHKNDKTQPRDSSDTASSTQDLDDPLHTTLRETLRLCEGLWLNLAEAYRRDNNPQEAISILHQALEAIPILNENATLHFNLAKAYVDAGDSLSSVDHYTIALRLDPNDLGAMFNLANAQVTLSRFPEAIELYEMAYKRGFLQAGVNLANTYIKLGFFTQALEIFKEIEPVFENDNVFLFNYANALNYLNADFEKTKHYYMRAIELDSQRVEYYINYAHFLLKNHHFTEGFSTYEMRKKFENMLPITLPNLWNKECQDTENLKDKIVFVYYEQGFGDCIMFGRFVPLLAQIAKEVILYVQEPLKNLFNDAFENIQNLKVCSQTLELDSIDVSISLLSLPLALGIHTAEQVQHSQHYLMYQNILKRALARGDIEEVYGIKPSILKIGICFHTDSDFAETELKNIEPKPLLVMLREVFPNHAKVEIHSVNYSGIASELCGEFGVYDCKEEMSDFLQTRKVLERLDVVISIDTALAHLSASLGKSTFVLLHKRFDWRYDKGVDSVWYENILGFVQSDMGKWENVLHNLQSYLKSVYSEYSV